MKKEYILVVIVGLFILAYVLEATINPLSVDLATPFQFLTPDTLRLYPFTAAVIAIRAISIFLAPLLLLSFADWHPHAKGGTLLVGIALMELYALQDIATGAHVVPLEWALSLSVAGLALLLPMLIYFLKGLFYPLTKKKPASIPLSTPEPPTDTN